MKGKLVRITKLTLEDGTTYMETETDEVTDVQARTVGNGPIDATGLKEEITYVDSEGTLHGFYATMRTNNREVLKRARP